MVAHREVVWLWSPLSVKLVEEEMAAHEEERVCSIWRRRH